MGNHKLIKKASLFFCSAYQTLVAGVSSDQAFTEAVSTNRVTWGATGHCTPGVTFTC